MWRPGARPSRSPADRLAGAARRGAPTPEPGIAAAPGRRPYASRVLDDGAVTFAARTKVVCHGLQRHQLGPERNQFAQTPVDAADLPVEDRQHVVAGALAPLFERQNLRNFRQGEAEALGGLDEYEAGSVVSAVVSVARIEP